MEKSKRSMAKTIWLSIRDTFSAMPVITTVTFIFQLISAGISVALVLFTARLIDTAGEEGSGELENLLLICAVIVGCYLVNLILEKISYRINQIDAVPKFEVFHHRLSAFTVSLSLEASEVPEISNMFWRAKDAVYQDRMGNVFRGVFDIIPNAFRIIGTALVLCKYHPLLVLLALLSIIPSFIIRLIYGQKRYELYRKQTERSRLGSYLWSVLTGKDTIKEMRVMGSSMYLTDKYFMVQRDVFEENKRFSLKSGFRTFLCDFFKIFSYAVSIAFCVYLLHSSLITIGAFSACLGAFTSMQGVSQSLLSSFASIKSQCNYANDYYDFFDFKTDKNASEKCDGFKKSLSARNLTFKYPGANRNAVDGVDFTVYKGEKIAVVGENGSGKTTLTKLLMGLYSPIDGEVDMDGKNISNFDGSYYENFSLVAQKFGKYSLTFGENIAFSKFKEINDEARIHSAAKSAGIDKLATDIGGLDTELGVEFGGKELSGGQWQKVALARGVFRDADILVLDEPTSALDPMIEYDILSDFINMSKNKTAFVISHRIGICRMADRIIVMKNGKIAEMGNHRELLAAGGVYADMWQKQSQWYEE